MDIADIHKSSKNDPYWNDLLSGTTGAYKHAQIDKLLSNFFPSECDSIIDIGCGSCETVLKYGKQLNAKTIACSDYDKILIEKMKTLFQDYPIKWHVNDIFDLKKIKKNYNLVFLLDMLHEIYSFYGRPDRDIMKEIDHSKGLSFVEKAIFNIKEIVAVGGGIIITDNVLYEQNVPLTIQAKTSQVMKALNYFSEKYTSKKIQITFSNERIFKIKAHDFCILLTQYNKIKNKNWERWNVEKLEIHQYMTLRDFQEMFSNIKFQLYHIIGTPSSALNEWQQDFKIIDGINDFPHKRITLLAIKN